MTRRLVQLALLAATYAVVARLGLLFDAVSGFATLVWPPTGIAIAALLVGGRRMWPAIVVGAFAANVWAGAPIAAAAGIACGNAVEAVLAATLARRVPGFDPALADVRTTSALVAVAMLASVTSATIGVASLLVARVIAAPQITETWGAWWLGDVLGALVVAPLILTWATASASRSVRSLEALVAMVVLLGTSWLVFALSPLSPIYAVFPILIWAAVRFGPRGAASATFVVAAVAVAATSLGTGPFAHADLHRGLLALQIFVGFVATTFAIVGALAAERTRATRALETALQTTTVARAHAERASAVKTAFLGTVSHELRTPLATLLLQIERLAGDDALREGMRAQAQRLHHLIDGILDYARVQSGVELEATELDPRAVVAECLDELRPHAEARALTVELFATAAPTTFVTDRRLLRLIAISLVDNALKFTVRGGVTVTIEHAGEALQITVRDTGPGIPAADQARVFEPFEQLDSMRNKHVAGVGLGLALVHEIVDALGGKISLESVVDQGSSFVVAIPQTSPDHPPRRG